MEYLIILLFLFFCTIQFDVHNKKQGRKTFWFICFGVFVLLAGLRYKVGADTFTYYYGYKDYPDFSEFATFNFKDAPYAFLWYVFCAICKTISSSFYFMQFVQAMIINLIYFHFIKKYAKAPFLGLLLFFIFGYIYFETEIMRESLAVGVFLLSIESFYERKWYKYFAFIAIAYFIHASALFLVILPLFRSIKLNKAFIISVLISLATASILWRIFNEYIVYLSAISIVDSKINTYLNDAYSSNINGMIRSLFTFFLVPFLFSFFAYRRSLSNYREIPFVWLYIIFGLLTMFNTVVFTRFQNYLLFPFLLFLVNFFWDLGILNKYRVMPIAKTKVIILLIGLFFGRYYGYFLEDAQGSSYVYKRYFPYSSIIDKNDIPERKVFDYAKW